MFLNINIESKAALRAAIRAGETIIAFSPEMGMPEVTGRTRIVGPWPNTPGVPAWTADVEVRDMRVVAVLPDWWRSQKIGVIQPKRGEHAAEAVHRTVWADLSGSFDHRAADDRTYEEHHDVPLTVGFDALTGFGAA